MGWATEAAVVHEKATPVSFNSKHPIQAVWLSAWPTSELAACDNGVLHLSSHTAASCSSHQSSSNGQEKHWEWLKSQDQSLREGLLFHPPLQQSHFRQEETRKAAAVVVLAFLPLWQMKVYFGNTPSLQPKPLAALILLAQVT